MSKMSLQQWFLHCNDNVELVKSYETEAIKFYKKLYPADKNKQYSVLCKPLFRGFYNKDKVKYRPKVIATTIKAFLISLAISAFVFMLFPLYQGIQASGGHYSFGDGFKGWFQGNYIINITKPIAIIIGVIILLIGTFSAMGLKWLSISSICSNLKKKEDAIIPVLEIVPVRFRSAEQIDTLANIYFKNNSVTFQQACDICDEFLREHKDSVIASVLFDVPYKDVLGEQITGSQPSYTISNDNNEEIEQEKPRNPALPSDIDTKTFNGSDDAEKDLNQMIGLDAVKDQIQKMRNRIQFYGSSDVGGGGNHMVFMGSAGVGKTTISRIITKIMYDFGYIKENKCVEISGDYLKSPYSGQTGERTNAIVEWAMGGVLFIDEAYLLYDSSSAVSQEATGVLLKAMEDHRKDIIIILAGYEEQMTKLLASNEGFNSRIKYKIYFPDYTVDEMYKIFTYFVNHYNGNNVYLVEDTAKDLLLKTFELEKQSKSFGNARTVRNAVDAVMDNYADRCITEGDKSNIIRYQDVLLYAQSRENELQHEIRNSSATNQIDESIIRLSELKNRVKEGSTNPDTDFSNMIGLDLFTDDINLLKGQKDFYGSTPKQNILLVGPDGCGKSTLARILTGYLYQYGYIKENRYLEISAEFLKGSYVGHTSRRADSIISYASGGVLFIKNIHLLTDSNDSFGQEALSAIINALNTDNNISIIISDKDGNASYNIQNLFSMILQFPDYTSEDLLRIFSLNSQMDGFSVLEETYEKLYNYLQTKHVSCSDIIQLYNTTKKNHINNFSKGISTEKYTLTPTDLDTNKQKIKLNLGKK